MKLKLIVVISILIIIIVLNLGVELNNEEINFIDNPKQTEVKDNRFIVYKGKSRNYSIEKLATYEIDAVIKDKKKYSFDGASEVSNYDFVLVWGQLDDKQIDEHIKYNQTGRWYHYRYDINSHVTGNYIAEHSANVHIIAKDKSINKIIKKLNKEDYVTLRGYLVNVHFTNGDWKSSLSRTDTGNGACEILYVDEVIKN